MANSRSNQKGDNLPSTLLTPCRAVGLRRKRPSPKDINSLLDTKSQKPTSSSPATPISTGLSRDQENTEIWDSNSPTVCKLENQVKEEKKNLKRKSYTLNESIFSRKRPIPRNLIQSSESSRNDDLATKSSLESNASLTIESVHNEEIATNAPMPCLDTLDYGNLVETDTGCCVQSSHEDNDRSVNTDISRRDIEQLKERIARKEKSLKELKLAALYRKKHDCKQVEEEIDCWLQACKEALYDLQSELKTRDQVFSLPKLLGTLGIPPSLIGIDEDDTDE